MHTHAPESGDDRPRALRRRRSARLGVGALLIGLAVVPLACGDDGSDSAADARSGTAEETDAVAKPAEDVDARTARDAIAAKIKGNLNGGSSDGPEVTDEQANCVADGAIDALGVEEALQLSEQGHAELTADQGQRLLPVAKRCVDFPELLAQQILNESEGKISAAAADCVAGKLDGSPVMDAMLTAALRQTETDPGQDEALNALALEAVTSCLSPEDLQKLGS